MDIHNFVNPPEEEVLDTAEDLLTQSLRLSQRWTNKM